MDFRIVVNKGSFPSIREAAFSERTVDWWDETDGKTVICTECFAAVELQKYLCRMTDLEGCSEIELMDAIEAVRMEGYKGEVLLIGNRETNPFISEVERKTGVLVSADDRVKSEGFRIKSFRCENVKYTVLSGKDRVGTLYAVYAFLETLGIRWYAPGEEGTCYPDILPTEIPDMDKVENPAFITRGCYSEYLDDSCEDLIEWAAHNRMNYARFLKISNPHNLKKRGIQISDGGHNVLFRFMDPKQEYPYKHKIFGGEGKPEDPYPLSEEYKGDIDGDGILSYSEAHPEWFAWIDGKRSFRRDYEQAAKGYFTGDNFCTSDQYAVKELCRLIVDDIISGEWSKVDYFNFWMLDNGKWCECEKCRKSGNLAYRQLMMVYSIDREIKAAIKAGRLKRNIRILFPAYHETLPVPDRPLPEDFDYACCHVTFFPIERCYVHYIDDERCTETNRWLLKRYLPWTDKVKGNYKGEVFIGEYYNVSSFAAMPFVLSEMISHDIPFYYKTGTRHFYYMHMTAGHWGMLALNNYMYARLLWDPFTDKDGLMSEYFDLYYKEVSDDMREFYSRLEAAMANCKYLKHYQSVDGKIISLFSRISNEKSDLFPLKHMQYDRIEKDENAGISLTETVRLIEECRSILDAALMKAENDFISSRVLEDDMRFGYGECIVKFIYNMIRTIIYNNSGRKKLAAASFNYARIYGEQLRTMTAPVEDYKYGVEFKNGLTASWIEKVYEKFIMEFGIEFKR